MLIWSSPSARRRVFAAAFLIIQAAPALAERDPNSGAPLPPAQESGTPSPITDRFSIEGIYFPFTARTGLRLDPDAATLASFPGLVGTPLSAEHDLGMSSRQNQARVEVMMRLRERSRVRLDFEQLDRSASQVLQKNIQFGNETFPAGQVADTAINWRMITLTYTYSLYRSDWLEIATGASLHMVQASVQGDLDALHEHQQNSIAVFYPTIPLDITWRFARRFALTGRVQYFGSDVGNVSGSLLQLHGDVQYRWTPNFSLGVGYTLQRVATEVSSARFPGAFSLDMRGEEAFFRVSF